jgi:hypothetical protein
MRSSGRQGGAAAAAVDPAKLPHEQQLPQIIELLHSKHVVSTAACMQQAPQHEPWHSLRSSRSNSSDALQVQLHLVH